MIAAIIPAAGASSRMGSPKALLKVGDTIFVRHIVDVLRSAYVQDIVIVLGAEADLIKKSLDGMDVSVAINTEWKSGQLSSIIKGIDSFPRSGIEAVVICPVDHPMVSCRLITDLLQAFRKSKKNIVVPAHKGRRGHPVIFSSGMFDEIRNASLDIGMRQVLRDHPGDVYEVETDEEGVICNIDTPEDYQSVLHSNRL